MYDYLFFLFDYSFHVFPIHFLFPSCFHHFSSSVAPSRSLPVFSSYISSLLHVFLHIYSPPCIYSYFLLSSFSNFFTAYLLRFHQLLPSFPSLCPRFFIAFYFYFFSLPFLSSLTFSLYFPLSTLSFLLLLFVLSQKFSPCSSLIYFFSLISPSFPFFHFFVSNPTLSSYLLHFSFSSSSILLTLPLSSLCPSFFPPPCNILLYSLFSPFAPFPLNLSLLPFTPPASLHGRFLTLLTSHHSLTSPLSFPFFLLPSPGQAHKLSKQMKLQSVMSASKPRR